MTDTLVKRLRSGSEQECGDRPENLWSLCDEAADYILKLEARKEIEAQNAGYNAAVNDSIGLLRKWFLGTNKDAMACENDLRKLVKK